MTHSDTRTIDDKTMITFRLSRSTTRDVPVVEVWADDRFIATICPHKGDDFCAIAIISKYLDDVVVDPNVRGERALL